MLRFISRRLPHFGRWPRLALAACCLLLALGSAAAARNASPASAASRVRLVVATHDLPAGRLVRSSDVAVVSWPTRIRPDGASARERQVVGRRLAAPVARNEPVSGIRLLGHDLTTGLSRALVALPVALGDPHAVELVHPGDRIEIYATPRAQDGFDPTPGTDASTSIVGSRLLVLAVLPGADDAGTEVVVAADRATAMRITQAAVSHSLAAVGDPP